MNTEASPRISIIRPTVLFDPKAISNETANSGNFKPMQMKSPINRRASMNNSAPTRQSASSKSPVNRRSSMNTKSPPPPPPPPPIPQIQALNRARDYMNQLLKQLNQVVKENDATPEVQTKLIPLVENVSQSYPPFHAQAVKYYQLYDQIQETTQTHQVLSTATVKIQLAAFWKAWEDLGRMIDIYADRHPPPHAKEISLKFGAIKSSLEIILQTNANRKFPNPGLGKSVLSIQSLCDSITNAVYELFMQERFPNFEIDSLSMYKADVKSFLRVITEAFYNEFPQSGVALCDLARIKLNVVASCNEIIEALKAAFVFPNSLKSVQKLKNSFNDETREIIETLQQQFNVVKPKNGNEIQFITAPVKKTKEEETLERIANDNVEDRLKNMDPSRRVELFLHDVLPFFDKSLSDFNDCWSALNFLSNKMKEFVKKYEVNDDNVSILKTQIYAMKKDLDDANEYAKKKSQVANEIEELRKREISDNQKEVEVLKKQILKLKNLINEKQEQMENIIRVNEVGQLRSGLEDIIKAINLQLNAPVSLDFQELKHNELIDLTLSLESTVYKEQQNLIKIEKEKLQSKIDELDKIKKQIEKNKNNDQIDAQNNENKNEQKNETDKNKDHSNLEANVSPNLHNNLSVQKKSDEIEKINDELVSSRQGHFSDLKLIISKLEGLIACQYESNHKGINDISDDQLLEDPISTRIELNGLINDQFQALQKLFRALLDNDKDNQKTIRELTTLVNKFKTELGSALEIEDEPLKLLSIAVNILTDKQNPLNDKIIELSNELRKRDSQEITVTSRLKAICKREAKSLPTKEIIDDENTDTTSSVKMTNSELYYDIKKNNRVANIMKLLGIIQDQFDEKIELINSLEKKSNLMQNFLYELEMRLRNVTKSPENQNQMKNNQEIDLNEDCDKVNFLIERIQNLCDIVVSPRFSDEFVKTTDLNKMFSNIPHDESKHPTEFIPQVCEKYITMQTTINSAKPFLEILDEIFQGIDDQGKTMKDNSYYNDSTVETINEQQFQLLQSQVRRLHQEMKLLNGATSNSPVSRLTSRFIALVQALMDRQAMF